MMIFARTEETTAYVTGRALGFLFSYTLFFSMLYFVLGRWNVLLPPYLWYISALIFLHLFYKLFRWVMAR